MSTQLIDFFAADDAGRILMTGTCAAHELALQSFPGATIRAGTAWIGTTWFDVETGQVRDLAPAPPQWGEIRRQRNRLLADTDWRITRAVEAGLPPDPAWVAYRQALRDITQHSDPGAITWPTPPEE